MCVCKYPAHTGPITRSTRLTHAQRANISASEVCSKQEHCDYTHTRLTSTELMMVFVQFCIKCIIIINIIRGETATLSPTCDELSSPQNNKCQIKTAKGWWRWRCTHWAHIAKATNGFHMEWEWKCIFAERFFSRKPISVGIIIIRQRWTQTTRELSPKNAIFAHGSRAHPNRVEKTMEKCVEWIWQEFLINWQCRGIN